MVIKRLIMITFFAGFLSTLGCVSTKKRPARLWHEVTAQHQTFDALIVPGVPYQDSTGWNQVMRSRVLWSCFLFKKGIVRNIIYSGGAVYSPYYEAKIMGLYAQKLGIPSAHIFYDTLAEHSVENIFYSYQIARQKGFKSIALGTDPVQSSMLKSFTRKRFATPIQHIPVVMDSLKQFDSLKITIDPSSAKKDDFKSIMERKNSWQRTKGTFGSYIPWDNSKRIEPKL